MCGGGGGGGGEGGGGGATATTSQCHVLVLLSSLPLILFVTRFPLASSPSLLPFQLEHTQLARKAAVAYQQHSRQDHKAAMHRKTLIEARKEYIENQSKAKVTAPCLLGPLGYVAL